jgi:photosystem II stability/assembly factor-like uncharacterized protein
MHFYAGSLYAATENEGVYRRWLGAQDSGWVYLDLPAKKLTSIFVFHTVCPLVCWKGIVVGSVPDPARGDSALIHFFQQRPDTCTKKGQWVPADTGLDRSSIMQISALAGIDMCQPVGPAFVTAFAAAPNSIWKSEDRGGEWKSIWQDPAANILTLTTKLRTAFSTLNNEVWAGGSVSNNQRVRMPFILRSTDSGEHWEDRSPTTSPGAGECRALALDPADTSTVYAAMNHAIIKSSDAGKSWAATSLQDANVSFHALAVNPQRRNHIFAGGALADGLLALYESSDAGESWNPISTGSLKGASSLIFDAADYQHVYVATRGTGVYRYPWLRVDVKDEERAPEGFQLSAQFPNPLHPGENQTLRLRVNLPATDRFTVRVFNAVGQEMAHWQMPLAAGEQNLALPLDRIKLSAGIYLLQAEWRGQRVTRKWTVVR